ncbi:MAG: hypothetical protein QW201_01565 [Thermoproteota archaeon]
MDPADQPHGICEFAIPEKDHLKFIEKIGTERSEHVNKFKLIKSINGKKRCIK